MLQQKLIGAPMVQWPNGITVDFFAERLYWVDAKADYIASCDLDGKNVQKIIEGTVRGFLVLLHNMKGAQFRYEQADIFYFIFFSFYSTYTFIIDFQTFVIYFSLCPMQSLRLAHISPFFLYKRFVANFSHDLLTCVI